MSDVRPILIGAGNALSMTGKSWPWWRRHANALGIELVTIGTASFAKASDVLAAVEKRSTVGRPQVQEVDDLAAFRERIRRAG